MTTVQTINISSAAPQHREAIVTLLRDTRLPTEDLPPTLDHFFVATDGTSVVGTIGLEVYGECGLLRSMVVHPNQRSGGIATRLVQALEDNAQAQGVRCMYLLTETAPDYFQRKGYERISRENVPDAIKASSEFSTVCPASAIVMKKTLSTA
jgi:amino-acid N-acetyltransferase